MTTLSDRQTPPPIPATDSRLRVVLLLDVHDGHEERFLAAYEQIRHQVASVPGHISDQLCQSLGNSSQWLITSEWESAEPFLSWVDSADHRTVVEPLHQCVSDTRSLRFVITRETPEPVTTTPIAASHPHSQPHPGTVAAGRPRAKSTGPKGTRPKSTTTKGATTRSTDPLPTPPLSIGGIVRHAITFTVKPGSEEAVADILSGYRSPRAEVDHTTRLCRTSLFMHGNRVVRAVEVQGDLGNALRYVATQPEVRAVEEAVNPYLEEARDFTDPASTRAFFARAALPAVHHIGGEATPGEVTRLAFLYPVRPGHGAAAAALLAEQDKSAPGDAAHPLAASTMFLREDLLLRLVDLRVPYRQAPAQAAGLAPGISVSALSRYLDLPAGTDLKSATGITRFLDSCVMDLITDRKAPPADLQAPAPQALGTAPTSAATGE